MILRYFFLVLTLVIGTKLQAQNISVDRMEASNPLRYSCMQIGIGPGDFPRIRVDKKAGEIAIEYPEYAVVDIYQFQDTLLQRTDSLDHTITDTELLVDNHGNRLIWEEISGLVPLDKQQIDTCLLEDKEGDEILQILPFQYADVKGVLVVLKRETMLYEEKRMAHIVAPFFYDDETCAYVEECGAIFWNNLERIYVTGIVYNNFPVILTLEERSRFHDGKDMRLIFNRIENK